MEVAASGLDAWLTEEAPTGASGEGTNLRRDQVNAADVLGGIFAGLLSLAKVLEDRGKSC